MSKTFQVSTLSTMGLGGGTIKRQKTCALLLIVGMIMCIFPSVVGAENQSASDNSATIGLNENKNVLEVQAASKTKKVKSTKKTSKSVKKTTRKTSKKVKAASKYKVKVRYYYKGKWRYKYVTKYSKVSAASSYTPSSSYTASGTADTASDPTLDAIMKSDAGFGYSSAYHTAAELQKHGAGDCWAYSEDLNNKFQAAGYQSRVIQYATSYSSQHRSVQLYQNGEWKTVPYRAYGYNYLIM